LKFIEDLKFYNSDIDLEAEPDSLMFIMGASSDAEKKVSFENK
jgi:hypothetical protein